MGMMDNLPKGWIKEKLPQVAKVIMGQSPPSSTYNINCDGLPFFQGKAEFGTLYPSVIKYCNSPKKIAEAGDILISVRAPVGPTNLCKEKSCIGRGLAALRPNQVTTTKYLLYYMRDIESWLSTQGTGSTFTAISKTNLENIEILLAPLSEQRRIVAKLEKLLQKVNACKERLDKIPTILKRFRQSILAAACSGRLTEDWREENPDVEPATELLKKIQRERKNRYEKECEKAKLEGRRKPKKTDGLEFTKIDDSRLPDIPENWCWAHLQNLGEVSRGRSKHRPRNDSKLFGGKYPFIQTGDVARSNGFIKNHNQTYNETGLAQSRLFPQNTLCITIAANIADTGIITYPACFPDSIVGVIPEEGMFEVLFAMYYVRIVQNDLQTFAPATAQKNILIITDLGERPEIHLMRLKSKDFAANFHDNKNHLASRLGS